MKKFLSFVLVFAMVLGVPILAYAKEATPPSTENITIGPPANIVVHRKSNLCGVYDKNNQLIRAFFVSTGKPGHETPLGVYKIYEHVDNGGYHPMEDGTYARYCMRFKQGGFMLHSVCYAHAGDTSPILEEVTNIGNSVSLGCVRFRVADAKWLYNATSNGCLVTIVDY